jgi:quercetin dioxygenase-like cupin family protein
MAKTMAKLVTKRFESSDDVRPFQDGKGMLQMIEIEGLPVGRGTFEPGWRWSDHVKPIAGTDLCEAPHSGYVLSGHMTVRMADGSETNLEPGDLISIPPGHDAWVVGQEPCVLLDWQGYADYAKPKK